MTQCHPSGFSTHQRHLAVSGAISCDSSSTALDISPSSVLELGLRGSNRESGMSKRSHSEDCHSGADSVGEGGKGMASGVTDTVWGMGGTSGISEGTGFRFCGVILLRLEILGDEVMVEGAMDDGSDDLESFIHTSKVNKKKETRGYRSTFLSSCSHRAVSHTVTMFSGAFQAKSAPRGNDCTKNWLCKLTTSFPRCSSCRKSVGFPIVILDTLRFLGVDDVVLMKPKLLETRRCTRTEDGVFFNGESKSSRGDTEQVRRESMVVRLSGNAKAPL